MIPFLSGFLPILRAFFCSRYNLSLEIMALRQQLGVLKRKNPLPSLRKADRLFWVLLRRFWSAGSTVLVIVKPETVVAWHRSGFRLFWRIRSPANHKGRPITDAELRRRIKRMASENPTWGAPRIHGELLQLGFDLSERTLSRSIRRWSPPHQARKLWAAFLRTHREVIAAMDFFTVPTLTFQVLYCFFLLEHGRRQILHCNGTEHPTGPWVVPQRREAFPESCPYRYAILDRDAKFGKEVTDRLASTGIQPQRIRFRSPWQKGVAERWFGSCRRELLDHVIILNDLPWRRLIREYISYDHEDRIHDSLEKDTPAIRPVASQPNQSARLLSFPRSGGLHPRYDWHAAA